VLFTHPPSGTAAGGKSTMTSREHDPPAPDRLGKMKNWRKWRED
jgi:hypothetical protein